MTDRVVKIPISNTHQPSRSVLIIYTGGTMGMSYDQNGTLVPFNFEGILNEMPELRAMDLDLTVVSFAEPIDSSNVTIEHWNHLAGIIETHYHQYQGFVVLHGTDTLAYSASALSFMLEGLQKPVIFTGSQLPIGATRSDARQNLVAALEIASAPKGLPVVKEVCIYFDYFLYRGNRCKKVESVHFDAFESENYPPLAQVGINIEYNHAALQPVESPVTFKVYKLQSICIALIKLFPGITQRYLEHLLATPGLQAVVLETYGSGNAPTASWFLQAITTAMENGVIFYNVSQCNGGRVIQGRYVTSRHLQEAGVISGLDITTEAALSKMLFLFSKYQNKREIGTALATPLRGEMGH